MNCARTMGACDPMGCGYPIGLQRASSPSGLFGDERVDQLRRFAVGHDTLPMGPHLTTRHSASDLKKAYNIEPTTFRLVSLDLRQ